VNELLLARRDASRTFALAGLLLTISALLLGEIYAIYISHAANGLIRQHWAALVEASQAGRTGDIAAHFSAIFDLSGKRGTVMGTHSHMGSLGLLALALAVLQPVLPGSPGVRRRIAATFLCGAVLQFGCTYLSYYAGADLLYLADAGGMLVLGALLATFVLLVRPGNARGSPGQLLRALVRPAASRFLLRAGLLLIALGMIAGLIYSWRLVTHDEPAMYEAIARAAEAAGRGDAGSASESVTSFKGLQSTIAITAAAHSHAIELGFLMLLLGLLQSFVYLSESWRMRWAHIVALGAFFLPVCVFLATLYGLRAAAFADLSGGLVVLGLAGMSVGVIRRTGAADAGQ